MPLLNSEHGLLTATTAVFFKSRKDAKERDISVVKDCTTEGAEYGEVVVLGTGCPYCWRPLRLTFESWPLF